jgi:hypothetical protein
MADTLQLQGSILFNTGRSGDITLPITLALNSLGGTVTTGPVQATLASGANAITLPITTVQFIYIKNTMAPATNTIAVSWTPTGGASAVVQTLRGGDFIIFSASVGAGSGATALSLNASAAATTCEYVLFG